ncbi:MAG TPA: AraC family transcriptional regulator [Chryseolinea sp.]|nr:AraC family transcriptional regulator [Chryseolinea sp.]
MKSVPVIDVDEFARFIVHSETIDGTTQVIYDHPTYGRWEQKFFELGMGRITEQRAELHRPVAVRIKDDKLSQFVHHCMCIDGFLGTSFEAGVDCELTPSTYHFLRVKGSSYILSLGKHFHNIHIEVSEEYYKRLLCDSEAWSARLKERFSGEGSCVAGAYSLTPAMVRNIYEIFNTPMSGMLKRMVIEAKMLELIALQWGMSINTSQKDKSKNSLLNEVKFYLDDTYLEEHSLKEICMRFGINEFALKSGFKTQFGTTVFDYLIGRRLDHARELLVQPGYSIQQISSLVGYKYSNHFSTAFKNRFGSTPRAFAGRVDA